MACYENDIKNGPYEITSNDGNYVERGTYRNGFRQGKIYVKKGREEDNLLYEDGELVNQQDDDD